MVNLRRTIIIAVLLCICMVAVACSNGQDTQDAQMPAATPLADAENIVCRVGSRTVTRADYLKQLRAFRQVYESYGNDFSDATKLSQLRELVLAEIIKTQAQLNEAEKLGYALDENELQQAQQFADAYYENVMAGMRVQAQNEGAKDVDARAEELMEQLVAEQGDTVESYKAGLLKIQQENMLIEKMRMDLVADVTVSEDEVKAAYEANLAAQKPAFDTAKAEFATAQENYDIGAGLPPVYVPAGITYVKHILVEDLDTANEVLDKLRAGEDFDTLVKQYNIDPGMTMEPYMNKGYAVYEGANYYPEFLEAALALENVGDLSEPVQTVGGYHILKLCEQLENKTYTYEEIHESYQSAMLTQVKVAYYNNLVEKWANASNIIKYTQRIADIY